MYVFLDPPLATVLAIAGDVGPECFPHPILSLLLCKEIPCNVALVKNATAAFGSTKLHITII